MTRTLAIWVFVALAIPGCERGRQPLRIGAKEFAEQHILGHMIGELAQRQGWPTRVVQCGDTYDCQQALQTGRIDLMVEYTGTALTLNGVRIADPRESLRRVRSLYEPLGLHWLAPLGFDNVYAVVMARSRAEANEIHSITDLEKLEEGVRVACPSHYPRRPGDGLYALARRHGLRLQGEPLLLDDPSDRLDAVGDGRADVAVVYGTDGALFGRQLRTLEDSLEFFPAYEAAVIVRHKALERFQGLEATIARLEDRIDEGAIRELNAKVQLEGRSAEYVAQQFLRERGLLGPRKKKLPQRAELQVVAARLDHLGPQMARVVRGVRDAFPQRAVRSVRVQDPLQRIVDGSARLALIGAERFFETTGPDGPRRDSRVEAVAVVGTRLMHLVRQRSDQGPVLRGDVGIPPRGSGGGRVAEAMLQLAGGRPARRAPPRALLRAVADGELDAALILARAPDPVVSEALADEDSLTLRPLGSWLTPERGVRLPYLQGARLPAETYPSQSSAVETVGVQLVLAGASRRPGLSTHIAGPGGALRTAGAPLEPSEVEALVDSLQVSETPDPVLPSSRSLRAAAGQPQQDSLAADVTETVLNVVVLVYLGWLGVVWGRRRAGDGP